MPVNLSENFDIGAVLGDPRGTNEDCLDRPASEADLKEIEKEDKDGKSRLLRIPDILCRMSESSRRSR